MRKDRKAKEKVQDERIGFAERVRARKERMMKVVRRVHQADNQNNRRFVPKTHSLHPTHLCDRATFRSPRRPGDAGGDADQKNSPCWQFPYLLAETLSFPPLYRGGRTGVAVYPAGCLAGLPASGTAGCCARRARSTAATNHLRAALDCGKVRWLKFPWSSSAGSSSSSSITRV